MNGDGPGTGSSEKGVQPLPRGGEGIGTPRIGIPTGTAEVQEPSPVIITGEPRLAVAVVVGAGVILFVGLVDSSAVSLRLVCLLATPDVPEVIKSETFTTAKYKSRVS